MQGIAALWPGLWKSSNSGAMCVPVGAMCAYPQVFGLHIHRCLGNQRNLLYTLPMNSHQISILGTLFSPFVMIELQQTG